MSTQQERQAEIASLEQQVAAGSGEDQAVNTDASVGVDEPAKSNIADITEQLESQVNNTSNRSVRSRTRDLNALNRKINNPRSNEDFGLSDYKASLDQRIEELAVRRKEDQEFINDRYDKQIADTEQDQANEAGGVRSKLVRMGGFLGESASHVGALVDLNQQHRDEINYLESQRTTELAEARRAYADQEFDLAERKFEAVQKTEQLIQDSKAKHFQRELQIRQEQRTAEQFELEVNELRKTTVDASERQGKVLDLIASGYEDPAKIMNFLNHDNDGRRVADFTLGEVAGVIDAYNTSLKDETIQVVGTPSTGIWQLQFDKKGNLIDKQMKLAPQRTSSSGSSVNSALNKVLDPDTLAQYNQRFGTNLPFGTTYAAFVGQQDQGVPTSNFSSGVPLYEQVFDVLKGSDNVNSFKHDAGVDGKFFSHKNTEVKDELRAKQTEMQNKGYNQQQQEAYFTNVLEQFNNGTLNDTLPAI